jgi:hypothetical protein
MLVNEHPPEMRSQIEFPMAAAFIERFCHAAGERPKSDSVRVWELCASAIEIGL